MNDLNGYDIEDLRVGMSATFSKTITEADIVLFAGVSGDSNAIHINEEYAATTAFKGRIAHGMLSASVISAAVANRLPGPGAIYLNQQLNFLAPVRPGDTVHATVTVRQVFADRGRVVLDTTCSVKGQKVIDGEALVKVDSSVRRAAKAAAHSAEKAAA
jgi:3-hydroxybutyryl-CoA dehydratase